MARIVFHTGFMKTGTTFLQEKVFPLVENARVHTHGDGSPLRHLMHEVRVSAPFMRHEQLSERVRGWIAEAPESLHLFSWEGMIGHYLSNHRDFDTLTRFIHRTVPQAKILLTIRSQGALLESLYKQALHRGHYSTPDRFINDRQGEFGRFDLLGPANIDVRTLDFDAFVTAYENHFGVGNVFVVPYELLRRDPARFYARLAEALGRPVPPAEDNGAINVGYSRTTMRLARKANRLFRTPQNGAGLLPYRPFDGWLKRHPAHALWRVVNAANAFFDPRPVLQGPINRLLPNRGTIYSEEIHARIRAVHADSNARLDARLGLGLKELGYY